MRRFVNFAWAIGTIQDMFRRDAELVNRGKWQGVDVSQKPEMATWELRHVSFEVPLVAPQAYDSMAPTYWAGDIKPNIPWADDHFAERVCGQPINPGVEWANWPYNKSADGFRDMDDPFIKETDWAYLAAMIDADGSIIIREDRNDVSKVSIVLDQVDHPFMIRLKDKYMIGQELREQHSNNVLSDRIPLRWQISQRDETKWVLSHIMKYLELKKDQAVKAFNAIPDFDRRKVGEKGREPIFNHNYMQRYWPKYAGMSAGGFVNDEIQGRYGLEPREGIYHRYGDLQDVVDLLVREPFTRQAYMPVFFPEDTGSVHGGRVPCSIGYHFLRTGDACDIVYQLRSCDFVRHFRDDIYLTVRLLLWVLEQAAQRSEDWKGVVPGRFVMHISNFHMFRNDYTALFGK